MFPSRLDGTSYYRGAGPLNELSFQERHDPRGTLTEINVVEKMGWSDITDSDLFFIQRPFRRCDLDMIRMAKGCGLPVWVDYDDDLLNVPHENPCWETYSQCGDVIRKCIELSDCLTTSTAEIAGSLQPHLKDGFSKVIHNGWNTRMFPMVKKPRTEKGPVKILWRGSDTHIKDLFEVKDKIWELARQNPDWEWTFLGYRPFFLDGLPNSAFWPAMDVFTYLRFLQANRYDVCIVPLANSHFNHCKSNCSWMEAAFAGAVTVAPGFLNFDRPGVFRYSGAEDFKQRVITAVASISRNGLSLTCNDHEAVVKSAQDHINAFLPLRETNSLRKGVIGRLLENRR